MAQVLRISASPDAPFGPSSLRRSSSHTSLLINSQPFGRSGASPPSSGRASPTTYVHTQPATSHSLSAPASPRVLSSDLSSECSTSSTPLSSLSLQGSLSTPEAEEDDPFGFPAYDQKASSAAPASDGSSTPTSTKAVSPPPPDPATAVTRRRSHTRAAQNQSIGDDTAVKPQPSRHVDYLSYEWAEEDLWSSWKHVLGKRETTEHWKRLENASWRAWAKSRSQLPTVHPDKVNWMKDHDVTWLYGPLQSKVSPKLKASSPTIYPGHTRTNSFGLKKSCLKKRSLSEAMLQRSLSTSTLVQQAVDSLVSRSPPQHRNSDNNMPDFLHSSHRSTAPSSEASNPPSASASAASAASSGLQTPCDVRCKRHIHFSDKVEQCIAIDEPDDNDFDDDEDGSLDAASDDFAALEADAEESLARHAAGRRPSLDDDESDASSDDGVIMMRAEHGKERRLSNAAGRRRPGSLSLPAGTPRGSFSDGGPPGTPPLGSANKTIAMLPATRLKYRGDTPEPPEVTPTPALRAPPSPAPSAFLGRRLASSASQETLKPARPSSNFLLDDDDEGGEDVDVAWHPIAAARTYGAMYVEGEDEDDDMRTRGLRRTASGMFMPFEDSADGDEPTGGFGGSDGVGVGGGGGGLLGRVADTVNTARDIAHVIWNVGWRQ